MRRQNAWGSETIMGRSITVRLSTGTIAVVALLGVAWFVALAGADARRANDVHTIGAVDTLTGMVQEDIKLHDDEETGVRGYLLTQRPEFLQPYMAARQALPALHRTMAFLLGNQRDARALAVSQARAAAAWDRWSRSVLRQRPVGRDGSALPVARLRIGKTLFDRYRAATARVLDALNRDRQAALGRGLADVSRLDTLLSLIFIAAIGLGLLIGLQSGRAVIWPLRALGRVARASGHGEETGPVAVAGAREFVQRGDSMEWMRRHLAVTEERLRATIEQKQELLLRALIEQAPVGACVIDADGVFETVNPAYAAICGYTPDELIGQHYALVAPPSIPRPDERPETREATETRETRETGETGEATETREDIGGSEAMPDGQHEQRIVTKDGWRKTILSGTVGLIGSDGRPRRASFVVDITERNQVAQRMERMAHYDSLTDLPNRALFGDRLAQALLAVARDPAPLALLLIDLNRFKEVNDTLGHDVGDLLLRQVATRMHDILRAVDTVSRLGGDEFAVLLPHTDEDGAIAVAHKLLTALTTPIMLQGRAVEVGGSIGIALHPPDGADTAALLRQADVAMYQAKQARSGYVVYRAEQDEHSPTRLTRAAELRLAIAEGQLRLYYQPVVDVASGTPRWVEALVRWQHPDHGLLGPDGFIPLAEETGLITPLTRWVLDEALRQCVEWERQGLVLGVAVNLSRHSLTHGGLPSMVADRLEYHDIMPERLTLEMTEGSVMTNPERARATLMSLAALGVRLAIDDFGTGYSSLGVLKTLPVHVLKTDKSFALQMSGGGPNTPDASIMGFIAALGRTLNLTVVAEGVETRGVWETLSRLGCNEAQGYYLCRPLPGNDIAAWLHSHTATIAATSLSA